MGRADRPSPDDGRGVEFLVGADDEHAEPDEELAQPGERRSQPNRLRMAVGLGALALLVVALIARAALSPDRTPQAARPSPTVSHEPTPTGPVTAPPYLYKGNLPPDKSTTSAHPSSTPHAAFPKSLPRRHGNDPAACPGLRCHAIDSLPTSVSDAIQATFPESTIERSQTVRLKGHHRVLWFRQVDVRAGSEQLVLRVQAPTTDDRTRSGRRTEDGQRTTFVETSLGPWHVEVDVVDLLGGQASLTALHRLATDPRIVAL